MKNFLLSTLACTLAVQCAAKPLNNNALKARQLKIKNLLLNAADAGAAGPDGVICYPPGGKVADPPGAAPRRVVLPSEILSIEGAGRVQKIKMRYGPYNVPNMMQKSIMGDSGALWNCGDAQIEKPCEECTILGLQAGLEYPNGTDANIDSGMWMHHMVAVTVGPGRWDSTCYGNKDSLPHFVVGTTPETSERAFSSGNERTPIRIVKRQEFLSGQKAGYPIRKSDSFRYIVDLMNMNMDDRVVYLTMTYDLIDGALPQGWKELRPVWFDVDQCGMSEVPAPQNDGSFTLTAKPWTPNFEGEIVGLGGHLHDGGSNIKVSVNDADVGCMSSAKYGESPKYVFKGGNMANGETIAENHISSMGTCFYGELNVKKLDAKQRWTLTGEYDYAKYQGNTEEGGKQAGIMAIALLYIQVPPGGVPPPKL